MELLSTQGMPVAGRAAAWGNLYATKMSLVDFTPIEKDKFDAELRVGQFGPVKLARLTLDRCSVERKQSHICKNCAAALQFPAAGRRRQQILSLWQGSPSWSKGTSCSATRACRIISRLTTTR